MSAFANCGRAVAHVRGSYVPGANSCPVLLIDHFIGTGGYSGSNVRPLPGPCGLGGQAFKINSRKISVPNPEQSLLSPDNLADFIGRSPMLKRIPVILKHSLHA